MFSKKMFLIAAMLFIVLAPAAFAEVTVPSDIYYKEITATGEVSTTNPVNDIAAIGFVCDDEKCTNVRSALNLANGGYNEPANNPPTLNSVSSSNRLNIVYPKDLQSKGYGVFIYKDGYIPFEVKSNWAGGGTAPAQTYYLAKKQSCFAPIENFTVINNVQANIPLVINMDAKLDADTLAAIRSSGPLDYVPAKIIDQYSVKTSITLTIRNSANEIVKTETKTVLIPFSGSSHVSFGWTPAIAGDYAATVATSVPDAKCISSVVQSQSKGFKVWAEAPRNACYTILNEPRTSTQNSEFGHETGDKITFIYTKLSNYANDYPQYDPNYKLVPVGTKATYIIKNSNNAVVYSNTVTLPANADNAKPTSQQFSWTPSEPGTYSVKVTGIADSTLCAGKTNPEESLSYDTITIVDTVPPEVMLQNPENNRWQASSNLQFGCSASDNAQLKNITLFSDFGGGWSAKETKTVSGTSATAAFSKTVPDGVWKWNCRAYDTSGNAASAKSDYTVKVDTIAPYDIVFADFTPANNAYLSKDNYLVRTSFKEANAKECTLTINGIRQPMALTGINECSTAVANQPDGTYIYNVSVADYAGNAGISETRTITLDNAAPLILSTYPKSDSQVHKKQFELNATTNEDAVCSYQKEGAAWAQFSETGKTVHRQSLSLDDGDYGYSIRCKDKANNEIMMPLRFTVFTKAVVEISALDVDVDQTDIFDLPITLKNTGYSKATGTLLMEIPSGISLISGSATNTFDLSEGASRTFTPKIEATMWGDYDINLTASYNGFETKKQVHVQSNPIPIYEFRIAAPDAIVVGDEVEVVAGLYNRGIVNGYRVPVKISTASGLSVVGDSQKIIAEVKGNDTGFANATYVSFNVKGVSAGSSEINITIDGKTMAKTLTVRPSPLKIDVSVDALAPFNMSLGRLFKVTAVIYNTGSTTINAVAELELDKGLANMSQKLSDIGAIPRTVNGVPPVKREWIVNGTEAGFKQINTSVKFSYYDTDTGTFKNEAVKDSIYVNILKFSEPVAPFIQIAPEYAKTVQFGKPFNVKAVLKNTGSDKAFAPIAVSIENKGSGQLLYLTPKTLSLNEDMARDAEKEVSWTLNATKTGDYSALISAAPVGHMFQKAISFSVAYEHDASLSAMAVSGNTVAGSPISISALLKNTGISDETKIPVILSVDGAGIEKKYYDLTAGKNTTASFTWTPGSAGTYTLSLFANLTTDNFPEDNTVSSTITISAAPTGNGGGTTQTSGGGGGGGGSGYYAPKAISDNRNATFANISIPESIAEGDTLLISGCAVKLGANSTVELYLDGSLKDSAAAKTASSCFALSGGAPKAGGHIVELLLKNSSLYFRKAVSVVAKPQESPEAPKKEGAEIKIYGISVEDNVYAGIPTKINVSLETPMPQNVSVYLYVGDAEIGSKQAIVDGSAIFVFNHTFKEAGKATLRAIARTESSTDLQLKEIDVKKTLPTGSFFARTISNPWVIATLLIAILGGGIYYLYQKGQLAGITAKLSKWWEGPSALNINGKESTTAHTLFGSNMHDADSPNVNVAAMPQIRPAAGIALVRQPDSGVYFDALEL